MMMTLSNAERQRRWRDKRKAKALDTGIARNSPLDLIVKDRIARGTVTAQERRLAVQILIKSTDPEEDEELLTWLRRTIG